MYRIDRVANEITPLKVCTFSDLQFKERAHLQEWIAKHPTVLGEDLLIIQKEFAGFSDTNERLDLLALDKNGSLVIIENKLDDAGKDVTWQALKYASYCASLTRDSIRSIYQDYLAKTDLTVSAEERLVEFFDASDFQALTLNKGITQRVMLVAGRFRKEVTSTVLWLANFGVRVQCFQVTPYSLGEELFLGVDQIIPTKGTEEFMISFAEKAREEVIVAEAEVARHQMRREFWTRLIAAMNERTDLYSAISPSGQNWIASASGVRGVSLNLAVTKDHGRAELYIDRKDRDDNLNIFNFLLARQQQIDSAFGGPLLWENIDSRRAFKIVATCDGNIFDRESWPEMLEVMTSAMVRLEKALAAPLQELKASFKAS